MQTTHDVRIGDRSVVKRFVSADRSEPEREWRALELLDEYAPGLAPRPTDFRRDPPVIEMTRLPGTALGPTPLSEEQIRAVAEALTALHAAVPAEIVERLEPRISGGAEMVAMLQQETAAIPPSASELVTEAMRRGSAWIQSADAADLVRPATPVFARADGNLANFVWDGERCRIVDFEDSGSGDLAYEIADLVEHLSAWLTGALDADRFLGYIELGDPDRERVHRARTMFAFFWLWMLLPGNPGHDRNPPGSAERQAERLLTLLT